MSDYASHPEWRAFLAAIVANPADDLPRLVFADWLDERGDPRGDFLRLECHLHRMPQADPEYSSLQRHLVELGRQFDRSWVVAVCRVNVEFDGATLTWATWADPLSAWTATAGGLTTTGNYREENQDHLVVDPAHPIAIVLDGMGGSGAVNQAAAVGGGSLRSSLAGGPAAGEAVGAYIRRALRSANDAVRALHADPNLRHIGATAVLAVLRGGRVYVSWAGDSMAYRVSRDGVKPLTWQHDMRRWLIRSGMLTEEEERHALVRNVLTHYLGGELPDPIEVPSFDPRPGDRLVLMTDGVHVFFETPEILAAYRLHTAPLACAEYLVRCALDRGSRDNATCVVIAFDGPPRQGDTETG